MAEGSEAWAVYAPAIPRARAPWFSIPKPDAWSREVGSARSAIATRTAHARRRQFIPPPKNAAGRRVLPADTSADHTPGPGRSGSVSSSAHEALDLAQVMNEARRREALQKAPAVRPP